MGVANGKHKKDTDEMIAPANFIILSATPADQESIDIAKRRVEEMNFTSDEVKIVKRGDAVLVITKREVEI